MFYAYRLFTDFRKVYDSVKIKMLSTNLAEFGKHTKSVTPIKLCLNIT
jgi:hypothetical protein